MLGESEDEGRGSIIKLILLLAVLLGLGLAEIPDTRTSLDDSDAA